MPITDYPEIVKRFLVHFKDCFTEPQFKHFAEYITGLIICMRYNISWMNDQIVNHRDQSVKNRFLTESNWSEVKVNKKRIELIQRKVNGLNPNKCYLLIDDVILHHDASKKMDEVAKFYDYSSGKYTIAHIIVTCQLITPVGHFPIGFKLYLKRDKKDAEYASKPNLAKELIQAAIDHNLPFRTVVFDSWYLSRHLSQYIEGMSKSWVSRAKSNRIVYIEGKQISLINYVKSIPKEEFATTEVNGKTYTYFSKAVKMSNQGKVRIVVFTDKEEESGFKILVTHELTWKPRSIIRAYAHRWAIDAFYRDAKQNLGLEDYMLRDLKGIKRHWYLVFVAFIFLQLGSMDEGLVRLFKNNAVSIGNKCRQSVCDTVRSFILWTIKQSALGRTTDEILQIIYLSKSKLRFQYEGS